MGDIKLMLNPETVALIGATEREGSVGRTIMENLLQEKTRKIFPVNPDRKTVFGVDCHPDLKSIPEKIHLAIIATPAIKVPEIVEECGKIGVEGVIIVTAGFKEIGEEGKKLEEEITQIRKKYGLRIIGPNCLGVIRPNIGLNASFLKADPEPGNIAFISQSGALGTAILDWAINAHIKFSMFASLGSMIDVDFGDLIDFLGDDPDTRSIMIYMESVGNAKKFMSATKGFSRNKPVIIVKTGRFAQSAKAALSHTGAMAGDDRVYDAAFKRAGAVRVKEVADLFNAAEVLDSKHLPKGPKLAIITNAGGPGVMATDALIELGGELAKLSDANLKELDSFLPPYWSKSNPIDVLGDSDIKRYVNSVYVCLKDPEVNGILIIYTPQGTAQPDELAKTISEIAKKAMKPIITVWMGGERVKRAREIFVQNDIPSYETPEEAVKTYLYMHNYGRNLELLYETPAELPVDQAPPKSNLKALIKRVAKEGRAILTEEESKRFLMSYGIPTTRGYPVKTVEEAVLFANKIGYPIVIKISSPDLTHKSDVGGVITGIRSDERLRDEYDKLMKRILEKAPQARIIGVTVQKMVENIDYEVMLGAKKDNYFGSVILFGLGGVTAEIFGDFSIGLPPLNQTLARILMEETKVYKMIKGFRGKMPADLRQLEQIIVSFSNLIVDFPEIAEMDINPLAISNGKAYALDARIIIDQMVEYASQYPHLVITPYPTKYVVPWKTTDGIEVILRPIRPEDEPLEREMLSTLSEQTSRDRFFQVIKNIPHEMLTRFCNIDYDRDIAIVAEVKDLEIRRLVGTVRIIIESDFTKGEFAVVVHDDYQGKGLGYKLLDMVIGIAAEKGLEMIFGIVLTDNRKMLTMCQDLGFTVKHLPEGISRVELILK
ncbi:MAG: bifunctional acetate--CoA ligase family protein/GNAT family N-acetyltransferase [Candidatus Methanoperedens sp.]|nr:bifunctional acetate--CoA ligase family protein/GNAT family N-acetyltransferase [Candidatus Methanoperedens sp.]MCE8424624.1 bifunctional acetate--CoA ligase family protein/GNAT family N-acetyltransferase [Candidatus Methanoperedens sp.]MCE8428240.1 bifunctional acetate--CoA ligase family protein/GNAT family N-acetyltransferase [Candidatus Methanoperedens sp.]